MTDIDTIDDIITKLSDSSPDTTTNIDISNKDDLSLFTILKENKKIDIKNINVKKSDVKQKHKQSFTIKYDTTNSKLKNDIINKELELAVNLACMQYNKQI